MNVQGSPQDAPISKESSLTGTGAAQPRGGETPPLTAHAGSDSPSKNVLPTTMATAKAVASAAELHTSATAPSKTLNYQDRPEWLKESIQQNFERLTSVGTRYACTGSECYAFCDCPNSMGLGGALIQVLRSDHLVANALKRIPADELKVLDLGAGDGLCLMELKEGREVLNDVKIEGGVNVSATAYREPSDNYRIHDVERLFDPSGAARGQPPIERGKFHLAISSLTFIHLKDPAGALQQAYEALAEGGVLAVDSLILRGLNKQELSAMMNFLRTQGYSIYGGAHEKVNSDANCKAPNGPPVPLDGLNPVIIRKTKKHPTLELPLRYGERASWSPTYATYELTCSKESPELTVTQKKLMMARAAGDDSQVAKTAEDAILCGDMETLQKLVKATRPDAKAWIVAEKSGNVKALEILGPPPHEQAAKALDELHKSRSLEKK